MARNPWTIQQVVDEGIVPAYQAAPAVIDGLSIPGTGDIWLHVKNGGGAPINVTIVTGQTLLGEPVTDKVVAVANGAEKLIGPFPPALYNQPSDGLVYVDFSAITSVTVGAFRR